MTRAALLQLSLSLKKTRIERLSIRYHSTNLLSKSQVNQFEKDGYLILPNFWSTEICDALQKQIQVIISNFNPNKQKKSIFSSKSQKRNSDEYFLNSGNQISFFFEENSFDSDENLLQDKYLSINKIGHGLHLLDSLFNRYSCSKEVNDICKSLGYSKAVAAQSMYIFKQPQIGGMVEAHQDGTFLATEPQSVLGFWWALDDCNEENACLNGIPGSHKEGIRQRFIRNPEGTGTIFIPSQVEPFDLKDAIPLVVSKGTLILLHHAFVHYSGENKSNKSRHAYTLHIIEEENTNYPKDNWLQYPKGHNFIPVFKEKEKN